MSERDASALLIEDRPVLFINVVITDASEAVKDGVSKKMDTMNINLPPIIKKQVRRHVSNIAADVVGAGKIVQRMAPRMARELPEKMLKKGISVHAEEVFREGPYFVIMMQVQHVDAKIMMEAHRREGLFGRCIRTCVGCMGMYFTDSFQNEYLPKVVQEKMQSTLGEMIEGEIAKKKMKAETEVLTQDKQARFFFAFLQQVREAQSMRKAAKGASLMSPNLNTNSNFPTGNKKTG